MAAIEFIQSGLTSFLADASGSSASLEGGAIPASLAAPAKPGDPTATAHRFSELLKSLGQSAAGGKNPVVGEAPPTLQNNPKDSSSTLSTGTPASGLSGVGLHSWTKGARKPDPAEIKLPEGKPSPQAALDAGQLPAPVGPDLNVLKNPEQPLGEPKVAGALSESAAETVSDSKAGVSGKTPDESGLESKPLEVWNPKRTPLSIKADPIEPSWKAPSEPSKQAATESVPLTCQGECFVASAEMTSGPVSKKPDDAAKPAAGNGTENTASKVEEPKTPQGNPAGAAVEPSKEGNSPAKQLEKSFPHSVRAAEVAPAQPGQTHKAVDGPSDEMAGGHGSSTNGKFRWDKPAPAGQWKADSAEAADVTPALWSQIAEVNDATSQNQKHDPAISTVAESANQELSPSARQAQLADLHKLKLAGTQVEPDPKPQPARGQAAADVWTPAAIGGFVTKSSTGFRSRPGSSGDAKPTNMASAEVTPTGNPALQSPASPAGHTKAEGAKAANRQGQHKVDHSIGSSWDSLNTAFQPHTSSGPTSESSKVAGGRNPLRAEALSLMSASEFLAPGTTQESTAAGVMAANGPPADFETNDSATAASQGSPQVFTTHTPLTVAGQIFSAADGEEAGWITVSLHPADIGPLQIRIDRDVGSLSAEIFAGDPQTLAWLDQNRESLLGALRDEGLKLDSLSLGASPAGGESGDPGHSPSQDEARAEPGTRAAPASTPGGSRPENWKVRNPDVGSGLVDLVA